jgi:predicted enzyme related to lactoylglutathione lyase
MADGTIRGEFVWHDLVTPNTAGAHEFYANAVGWKTESWDKDQAYQMFAAPSGPIGGTVENKSTTPHWLAYIGTPDVDAAVDTATRLGARVLTAAAPLPNGGRYATLADPQGGTFGIYASSTWAGPDGAPKVGEFSWHELASNVEPNEAFKFYSELFAWDEISQHDMGAMGPYLIFGRNGRRLGGIFNKGAAGKPGSAYWLSYVSVADLDACVEQSKAARGSVLVGPMDVPDGDRIAQLMDPYGAFFALHMAADGAQRAPAKQATAKPAAVAKPAQPAKAAAPNAPAAKPAGKPAAKPAAKVAVKPAAKPAAKKAPAKKAAPQKKAAARKPTKKKPAAKKKPATRQATKPKAKPKAKVKAKPAAKAKAKSKAKPKAKPKTTAKAKGKAKKKGRR